MPAALAIDDDVRWTDDVSRKLQRLGFTVTTKASADSGLKILESGSRFDLVVTDFNTSSAQDGMAVMDYCHANHIAAILLTSTDEAEQAARTKGYTVISKPELNREALQTAVQQFGLSSAETQQPAPGTS